MRVRAGVQSHTQLTRARRRARHLSRARAPQPSADNVATFQPRENSYINPDHLHYFRFVGLVVGKALYDGYMLDAHFTRPFYKVRGSRGGARGGARGSAAAPEPGAGPRARERGR